MLSIGLIMQDLDLPGICKEKFVERIEIFKQLRNDESFRQQHCIYCAQSKLRAAQNHEE